MSATGSQRDFWHALRDPRWIVYAVVAAVAVFCFVVSYSHIYDLGRHHAQAGTAARLLPLSVDGLIVAATLVMFIQGAAAIPAAGLARWLPRGTLWGGIAATVLANVAYGLPSGWESAVISGWPGGAFVAAVEIGIVAARMAPQSGPENENPAAVTAGAAPVPASVVEAAAVAYAASVAAKNPLPERQLVARFGITRAQAKRIRTPPVVAGAVSDARPAPATLNGAAAHE